MPRKLTEEQKHHRKLQREAHAAAYTISEYFRSTEQNPVLDNDLCSERDWMLEEVRDEFAESGVLALLISTMSDLQRATVAVQKVLATTEGGTQARYDGLDRVREQFDSKIMAQAEKQALPQAWQKAIDKALR